MKKNVIKIDLDNKDEYINKYDDNKLSDELHNYIISKAMKFNNRSKIVIEIKFNFEVEEEEKRRVKKLIREDFLNSIKDCVTDKSDIFRKFYLIVIGISCIFISFTFNYINVNLISEIFMIIGWVAIWEIVDNFLFVEMECKRKKRKYELLLKSDIIVN